MFVYKRLIGVLAATVLFIATAYARQASEGGLASGSVRLNIVVTTASGQCVTDLHPWDFTIFDNDSVQPITSFGAVKIGPKQAEAPRFAYVAGNDASAGCYAKGGLFQYEITYAVPDDARPNQYRRVEVKVDKPNLIIQTRQGYYVQP